MVQKLSYLVLYTLQFDNSRKINFYDSALDVVFKLLIIVYIVYILCNIVYIVLQ